MAVVQNIDDLENRARGITTNTGTPAPATGTPGTPGTPTPPRGIANFQPLDAPNLNSNVSDIAADMIGEDNRFMRAAATKGRQIGNRRGLLNSSITVGASMDAMMDHVRPMAEQEARQRHETNRSGQDYQEDASLSDQDYGETLSLQDDEQAHEVARADQDFEHASALQDDDQKFQTAIEKLGHKNAMDMSRQDFQEAMKLSAKDFKEQMGLSKQQFRFEYRLQKQKARNDKMLANLDADTRKWLMKAESDMREMLANKDIKAGKADQMSKFLASSFDQYQTSIANILGNPNLPKEEREKMLANAGEFLQQQVTMTEDLYGASLDWFDKAFDPYSGLGGDDDKGGDKGGNKGKGGKGGNKGKNKDKNPSSPGDAPGGR